MRRTIAVTSFAVAISVGVSVVNVAARPGNGNGNGGDDTLTGRKDITTTSPRVAECVEDVVLDAVPSGGRAADLGDWWVAAVRLAAAGHDGDPPVDLLDLCPDAMVTVTLRDGAATRSAVLGPVDLSTRTVLDGVLLLEATGDQRLAVGSTEVASVLFEVDDDLFVDRQETLTRVYPLAGATVTQPFVADRSTDVIAVELYSHKPATYTARVGDGVGTTTVVAREGWFRIDLDRPVAVTAGVVDVLELTARPRGQLAATRPATDGEVCVNRRCDDIVLGFRLIAD